MVRSMKRQRDGAGGTEELRGHCLFSSYRPLAPSLGSNPEQRGLQLFSQQPSHEAGGSGEKQGSETQMKAESEGGKPYILHVHASVKPVKGAPPVLIQPERSVGLVSVHQRFEMTEAAFSAVVSNRKMLPV